VGPRSLRVCRRAAGAGRAPGAGRAMHRWLPALTGRPCPSPAASLQRSVRDPQLKTEVKPPESVSGGLGHRGQSQQPGLAGRVQASSGAGRQDRAGGLGALGGERRAAGLGQGYGVVQSPTAGAAPQELPTLILEAIKELEAAKQQVLKRIQIWKRQQQLAGNGALFEENLAPLQKR